MDRPPEHRWRRIIRSGAAASLGLVVGTIAMGLTGCTPDGPSAGETPSGVQSPATAAPTVIAPSTSGRPTGSAAPSSDRPAPPTTPVPQSSGGGVTETESPGTEQSKKPVRLDKTSENGKGLSARVSGIKAITATAKLPGEVSGPGVAITIRVENTTDAAQDLGLTVVTVADSDDAPAGEITGAPAKPFSGSLAAGKTAIGVYVFTLPKDRRDPVVINVTIGTESAVMVFTGKAP